LSDEEVRKFVTNAAEPVFPPGSVQKGNEVIVQISVDETGKLAGIGNTHSLQDPVFFAVYAALHKWHFSPYIKNGKPQYFHANVVFRAQ
jgi:outer membrane biosynthesis protein TonB